MKRTIEVAIAAAVKELFDTEVVVVLTRPEEQFGDYATNVALQLAGPAKKNPREIAQQLAEKLQADLPKHVSNVTVAGPGFLNITLSDAGLAAALLTTPSLSLKGKEVVAEYSDPNPFKVLHAGHLYTSVVGDSVANLLEEAGAQVHRVNFGGDVGLHVAKSMWAILQYVGGEDPSGLKDVPASERADWLSARYVEGNEAYESDEQASTAIMAINKRIYALHDHDDHDSPFAQVYWTCRQWSYDYFNEFYARLGISFEKYYPESETAPLGLTTVRAEQAKGVYEQSQGAVVFDGEKYGLHTRVFITSAGLPTYEAKEVGLIMSKWRDYHFDRSVIITGNDIVEYMKVVLKSVEQFRPELAKASTHLTHGQVKLPGGVKMSSRMGNTIRAVDILDLATAANKKLTGQDNEQTVLGAVKYAFLKSRMGGDIIYDPDESVSLVGNSGPYLQYAHARARGILQKADTKDLQAPQLALETAERSLALKVSEYAEVIDKAVAELLPHHICTYLYELAQNFNSFYEHNRVIGDGREAVRLWLVSSYADTLKYGLTLLGIVAPERL
jgi:arginyl-tRNA synthetase